MQICLRGLYRASFVGALAIGCSAQLHGNGKSGGSGASTGAGATGATAGLGSGGSGLVTGSGGTGAIAGPGEVTLPDGTKIFPMYQRIRRLTIAEYENSVNAVVHNTTPVSSGFTPDSRQQGFTVNDAQQVDSVLAKQVSAAADTLAAQVVAQLNTFAPCADPTTQADQCATTFIQSFAQKAYRRPVEADEVTALMTLFHSGSTGGTYADGIQQVARGVLQAASFLYLTEIGDPTTAAGQAIKLTPYEIAAELSYMFTASPPDDPLNHNA
jgi:hypothetical protein